jgi:hypothetical protein
MNRILTFLSVLVICVSACRGAESDALDGDLGFAVSPSLRQRILAPQNIKSIMQIRTIESFVRGARNSSGADEGYVVIAIDLSLKGDFRLEGAWHGRLCYVRRISERTWEKSVELYLPSAFEFERFRSMSVDELEEFVAKHRAPNQPSEPTSGIVTPGAAALGAPIPPVAHL